MRDNQTEYVASGEGMAGRIVLVVDAAASVAVHNACAELAASLADRAGLPVKMTTAPITSLDALRPALDATADRIREFTPLPRGRSSAPTMSAAPFVWRADGRPDWSAMWTTFCELALYGGPPHRGPESALRAPAEVGAVAESGSEMLEEMRRGIWETTGLYAEPAAPGWLAVTCESRTMAAWLCAAKTHHYWQAHITGGEAASGASLTTATLTGRARPPIRTDRRLAGPGRRNPSA